MGAGENVPDCIPKTLPPPNAGDPNASVDILVSIILPPLVSVNIIELELYEALISAPADIAALLIKTDRADPLTAGYPA